jgi:hypothetical protein
MADGLDFTHSQKGVASFLGSHRASYCQSGHAPPKCPLALAGLSIKALHPTARDRACAQEMHSCAYAARFSRLPISRTNNTVLIQTP